MLLIFKLKLLAIQATLMFIGSLEESLILDSYWGILIHRLYLLIFISLQEGLLFLPSGPLDSINAAGVTRTSAKSKQFFKSMSKMEFHQTPYGQISTTCTSTKPSQLTPIDFLLIGCKILLKDTDIFQQLKQVRETGKAMRLSKATKGMYLSKLLKEGIWLERFGLEILYLLIISIRILHNFGKICSNIFTTKSSSQVFGLT